MEEINITHFHNKKDKLSRIDEIVGKSFESVVYWGLYFFSLLYVIFSQEKEEMKEVKRL